MTIVKLRTWWRIQSRIFSFYCWDVIVPLLFRPIVIIFNLLMFLSIPIWVGPAYMGMMLLKAWESKKNVERDVFLGKIWFHEMYRMF